MSLRGEGLLALWGDAEAEGFDEWYTHEHLPERIAMPGFLRARRFVGDLPGADTGLGRYVTLYETDTVAALVSPEYVHALDHPTPLTSRYMPQFAAMSRTACRVVATRGAGTGGGLDVVDLAPPPRGEDQLRRRLVSEHLPAVAARNGVLGVHLVEADHEASALRDRTAVYRDLDTSVGAWLLLVEGAWTDLDRHRDELAGDVATLRGYGAVVAAWGTYRLLAQMEDGDA